MENGSAPSAEEELDAKLKQCDPVVQGYVAGLKADNLKLQSQITAREKIKLVALGIVVLGILTAVAIVSFALFYGLGAG
jgi:hypothetical protein